MTQMQTNKILLPQAICKKIIEKFVARVVILKESTIMLRGQSVIL